MNTFYFPEGYFVRGLVLVMLIKKELIGEETIEQ